MLSKPKRLFSKLLRKRSHRCISYAFDAQQGARLHMEDSLVINENFAASTSLFAVFDGHGGHQCSQFLAANIESYLSKHLADSSNIQQAFENTMKSMDDEAIAARSENASLYFSGSTALLSLVDRKLNKAYISHVGDSRCITIDKHNKITQWTKDHHPKYDQTEKQRLIQLGVLAANGIIPDYFGSGTYKVAMTRCIGNGHLKHLDPGLFLSVPDVIEYEWTDNDKYLILCSDGLFDTVAQFKSMFYQHALDKFDKDLSEFARLLTKYAIWDDLTGDNVSVIVIQLNV